MRLVLDTNVVVSAVLGTSAPARLIELAAERAFDLCTSEALMAELTDVLDREHIRRRLESNNRSAFVVLALYEGLAERLVPAEISRTAPDPDDDAVLACALAAGADLIISGDRHLRNLKSFHRIPILSPADALTAMLSQA